jgi:hypothetical protein
MTRLVRAAVACAGLLALAAAPAGAAKHDWTRFGFDAARSNSSSAVAGIGAADLSKLKRQDVALTGTPDSSPVYLHHIEVMGHKRDVFVVGTSYGRVFAVGADTGKILWTYTPPTYNSLAGGAHFTTSSPVADRARGFVYAASPDGFIRKLSLKDGTEVVSQSWPAAITLDAPHEKISSSLNLSHGYVIATTAAHAGDAPPYLGHVALVDRDSGQLKHVFNALCSKRHQLIQATSCPEMGSGIWGRSGAVVVPGSHRLLVTTGNAAFDGKRYWGDTVLELSPDATQLIGNWTPGIWADMNHYDVDLGSTAPALMRSGGRWLALQGGKDGTIRLLDVADPNGHGHPCFCTKGELQELFRPGNIGIFSTPAIWHHAGHDWAFVTTYSDTTAFRLSGNPPRLHKRWMKSRGGSSPVIAGGLLYVYDPNQGGINVYRPDTGKRVGNLPTVQGHWSSPVVADGRVAIPVGNANQGLPTGVFSIFRKP